MQRAKSVVVLAAVLLGASGCVLFQELPPEQGVNPRDTGSVEEDGGDDMGTIGDDAGDAGVEDAGGDAEQDMGREETYTIQGDDSLFLIAGTGALVRVEVVDGAGEPVLDAIISWRSEDDSIATVDADGVVTAVSAGRVEIVASYQDAELRVLVDVDAFEARQIDVGPTHACGVDVATSRIACWGAGSKGELGDGRARSSATPRYVPGDQTWSSVSVGRHFTCGITTTSGTAPNIVGGDVFCWGFNDFGQLGDGSEEQRNEPVKIKASGPFSKVDAGDRHACAVRSQVTNTNASDGSVLCWGSNSSGQTSAPLSLDKVVNPRLVTTGAESSYKSVSVSADTSCAVSITSSTYCWGAGGLGQLGDGNSMDSTAPVEVALGGGAGDTVEVGDGFACSKSLLDEVHCWGDNSKGQLGTAGAAAGSATPVRVGTQLYDVISARVGYACGVIKGGTGVECWGEGTSGQLGDGALENNMIPARVTGLASDVKSVSVGERATCGLTDDGVLGCWGERGAGLLGDGVATVRVVPEKQLGARQYEKVAAMQDAQCALAGGKVYCWGIDDDSRIGQGTINEARVEPGEVQGLEDVDVTALATGRAHGCALGDDAKVYCWGDGDEGQLGDGLKQTSSSAVEVTLSAGATAIALGAQHTCALLETGEIECWGDGRSGQLGAPIQGDGSLTPIKVDAGPTTRFVQITAGDSVTCAISTTRDAYCWGSGADGRLGNGATDDAATPSLVSGGDTDFEDISAGYDQVCALDSFGALYCWGRNSSASFGAAGPSTNTTPVPVSLDVAPTLDDVEVGRGPFACGVRQGQLFCWGDGLDARQGSGLVRPALEPVQIELPGGVTDVSLGTRGACATLDVGDLYCWGGLGAAYGFDGGVYGPRETISREAGISK